MIEVEIKSLLQSKENAESFSRSICSLGFFYKGSESQLNHYFLGRLSTNAIDLIAPSLSIGFIDKLKTVLDSDKQSVRTRQIITEDYRNPVTLLIVKVAISGTSENGSIRKEIEVPVNGSIDRLDGWLLEAGLQYQSKWSRERDVYISLNGVTATVDKNAGYGYVAELERMTDEDNAELAKTELLSILRGTGFEELSSDRLDRMFNFYNANWQEYYSTNKTFEVE